MNAPHLFPIRVYYEDTDFSGFVYHANYLRFLERGRTELLRAHDIVQSDLRREADAIVFVVARMVLDYLKPAVMDDQLMVATTVAGIRGASMIMNQVISRAETVLVRAEVTVAAVRAGRAVRLPKRLVQAFQPTSGREGR